MADRKNGVRAVIKRWHDRWEERYGRSTHRPTAKELGRALELVRARGKAAALRAVDAYFDDGNEYVRRARHPLALLLAQADTYAGEDNGKGAGPRIATVEDFDVGEELRKPGRGGGDQAGGRD